MCAQNEERNAVEWEKREQKLNLFQLERAFLNAGSRARRDACAKVKLALLAHVCLHGKERQEYGVVRFGSVRQRVNDSLNDIKIQAY